MRAALPSAFVFTHLRDDSSLPSSTFRQVSAGGRHEGPSRTVLLSSAKGLNGGGSEKSPDYWWQGRVSGCRSSAQLSFLQTGRTLGSAPLHQRENNISKQSCTLSTFPGDARGGNLKRSDPGFSQHRSPPVWLSVRRSGASTHRWVCAIHHPSRCTPLTTSLQRDAGTNPGQGTVRAQG